MKVYFLSAAAHPYSFGSVMQNFLDEEKTDELSQLLAKVTHIAQHGGHPSPPIAKPLREVAGDLNEIRHKLDQNRLLRVYYFVDRENKRMILLNSTIKPDGSKLASHYTGKAGKKLQAEIEKDIQEALHIKQTYSLSSHSYELLSL